MLGSLKGALMALCPHCSETVSHADVQVIPLQDESGGTWRGLSYSCPNCQKILTVGFDPVRLDTNLVATLMDGLKGHLK